MHARVTGGVTSSGGQIEKNTRITEIRALPRANFSWVYEKMESLAKETNMKHWNFEAIGVRRPPFTRLHCALLPTIYFVSVCAFEVLKNRCRLSRIYRLAHTPARLVGFMTGMWTRVCSSGRINKTSHASVY